MHIIQNKKLNIQILDKTYSINKPKFKEVMDMEDAVSAMKPKEKVKYIEGKLVSYGIPLEVLNELDGDAYVELMEVVHGTKKNFQPTG